MRIQCDACANVKKVEIVTYKVANTRTKVVFRINKVIIVRFKVEITRNNDTITRSHSCFFFFFFTLGQKQASIIVLPV